MAETTRSPLEPVRRRPRPSPAVYQRRRVVAVFLLVSTLGLVSAGVAAVFDTDQADKRAGAPAATPTPAPPPELPRGGRDLLPAYRVVAYYGHPGAAELGVLGIGTPTQATGKLRRQARRYVRPERPVMPALELLATIVTPSPGADGLHRIRQPAALINRYLRAARRARALLVLDIQPGTSDFLTEAKALRRWLREPDVGLALDPEWRMQPGQIPGQVIGGVSAAEVNRTAEWLSRLTRKHDLPEKLLLVHQFTHDMIGDREQLRRQPRLAMTLNVDGFGGRAIKIAKYRDFVEDRRFHFGFKLFYREDQPELMRPREVMRLRPAPDVVVYE